MMALREFMRIKSFIMIIFVLYISFFTVFSRKLPIIAILANAEPENAVDIKSSKVFNQYVRWIEQSLADVVVIHPWYNEAQLDDILSKVNGVLWQGGNRDLVIDGQFENTARNILKKILEKKDKEGISIPLWGTCQGFELLHVLVANNLKVLTHFEAEGISLPIKFVTKPQFTRMFSDFRPSDIHHLQKFNTTAHFHHLGVAQEQYNIYSPLNEFFKVTSIGKDKNGKVFISTVEAKEYPVYSIQFHPEMVAYTKNETPGVPQSIEAIKISNSFSVFFLAEARLNNNTMSDEDKKKYDFIDSSKSLPQNDDHYYFNKTEMLQLID